MNAAPALVYAAANQQAHIDRYLTTQSLYRWDDLVEDDQDYALPPDQRPILRRLLLLAHVANGMTAQGEPHMPTTVVIDHLANLGPDLTWQTAVVGALMDYGFTVHADYQVLPPSWYFDRSREIGFATFGEQMTRMRDLESITTAMVETWAARCGATSWILPRSMHTRREETADRTRELIDHDRMSFTRAAQQLTVEGHPNPNGRVKWYTKAVRDLYEQGQ